MSIHLFISIGFILFCAVEANDFTVKTWNVNTNFDNSRNWLDGKLPCSKDRVIFGSDANIVTAFSKGVSFAELVLPMEGELIFLDGTDIKLNEPTNDESCKGQDVHFMAHSDSWYDPSNWNISRSFRARASVSGGENQAVPHSYRIPCFDDVVFPKNASFTAVMDSSMFFVSKMEINSLEYTENELNDLLESNFGKLLFPGDPKIYFDNHDCEDKSGCYCGNDIPQVLNKICSHVTCPTPECADPSKPNGYCCPICAAYLNIDFAEGFDIDKLVKFENQFLEKSEFKYVDAFTLKSHADFVQAIFVDSGETKGTAAEVGQIIHNELIKDMSSLNSLKLKAVKLVKSVKWNSGVPTSSARSNNGISAGGVVAIIVIIAVIIGAGAAWYIYKRRQIPGFSFARFDLRRGRIELELDTTPHEDLDPEDDESVASAAASPNSFDNPVYDIIPDQKRVISKEEKVEPLIDTSEETENIIENPMFISFEPCFEPKDGLP